MEKVKELFEAIGKGNVSQSEKDLLSSGAIDSLDIMSLVNEIEKRYGTLDMRFIEAENFENFEALAKMLKAAYGI